MQREKCGNINGSKIDWMNKSLYNIPFACVLSVEIFVHFDDAHHVTGDDSGGGVMSFLICCLLFIFLHHTTNITIVIICPTWVYNNNIPHITRKQWADSFFNLPTWMQHRGKYFSYFLSNYKQRLAWSHHQPISCRLWLDSLVLFQLCQFVRFFCPLLTLICYYQ